MFARWSPRNGEVSGKAVEGLSELWGAEPLRQYFVQARKLVLTRLADALVRRQA